MSDLFALETPLREIALVAVGSLAADAIRGEAKTVPDVLLPGLVVLLWGYLFNLVEYPFPRFRRIAQDTPTLLIHERRLLKDELRGEKLTEQELAANLRKQGIARPRAGEAGWSGGGRSDPRGGGGLTSS